MSTIQPYRDSMNSLDCIAITIEREGFGALDMSSIDTVLDLAATASASPVLAEVFADDDEPAPVRERAFGLLAMQITAAAGSATTSRPAAHQLRPRSMGSMESTPRSTSTARSRRSRVPVPASGGEWRRSYWPTGLPTLR